MFEIKEISVERNFRGIITRYRSVMVGDQDPDDVMVGDDNLTQCLRDLDEEGFNWFFGVYPVPPDSKGSPNGGPGSWPGTKWWGLPDLLQQYEGTDCYVRVWIGEPRRDKQQEEVHEE